MKTPKLQNNNLSHDDLLNSLVGSSDIGKTEEKQEEFYKSIREMYTKKNLQFITDLSQKQINAIIKIKGLYEFSNKKVAIFKYIIENFMALNVSKQRKSRGEFFETFKSHFPMESQNNGLMQKYFSPRM